MTLPPLPPRDLVIDALQNAMLPAFAGALVILIHFLWTVGKQSSIPATAYALCIGMIAANAFRDAIPLKPEKAPWHYLMWIGVGVSLLGTGARNCKPVVAWAIRIALALAVGWLLVPTEVRHLLPWLLPAFAGGILIQWFVIEACCTRNVGGIIPLALVISFAGASGVLIHAHIARLTDFATIMMSALLAISVVSFCCKIDCGGVAPAVASVLPGLMLCGKTETYSEVPMLSFLLVGFSPIALLPCLIPAVSRMGFIGRGALILITVSIPVTIAMIKAMQMETLDFG